MFITAVIADILLVYFLFGHSITRRLASPPRRVKLWLRDYERHFQHLLRRNRDILSAKERQTLENAIAETREARLGGDQTVAQACLDKHRKMPHIGAQKPSVIREYLEVFVVALALAFGVRGLFLQPFKIPTGSMQPTLYGIHFVHADAACRPNPLARFFGYINYSRRYVDIVIKEAGYVEDIRPAPSLPLLPTTAVRIGGVTYRLPGSPDKVRRYCAEAYAARFAAGPRPDRVYYEAGDVLVRGYLELGDHLFVDRTYFAFQEPKRGDITVFLTDGIEDSSGHSLGGRYYIKRLVGLPGDELRITDHRLYIRPAGEEAFRLADESVREAFRRIASFKGGYRGYCHFPGSDFLSDNNAAFTVPEGHYFMLGDNSENSKDSRFWGTVPRRNLIGRSLFVWWPFCRRWGLSDRLEPLDTPTPPTMH